MQSPETTHASISNPGTEKRHNVGEELVEERDALCSLGSLAESARLSLGAGITASVGAVRQRVVHEVGVEDRRAIVGETLAQLNESNGEHGPGDLAGNTAKGAKLLLGRLAFPVILIVGSCDIGVLDLLAHVHRATGIVSVEALELRVGQTRLG